MLLCGGAAQPSFGGGEIREPIEFYLAGRVTSEMDGRPIPVVEIAVEACRKWIKAHIPDIDVERHIRIIPKFRPGSAVLRNLFSKGKGVALSNDSSCGVGFAPFTPLERVVLYVESALNGPETKQAHPAIGPDIKVLGVRYGSRIHLTISCAMIGRHLARLGDYLDAKAAAREIALAAARRAADLETDAVVNVADDAESRDVFLTVTGTSAEAGDDGEVGRGNRTSGLITPYRPMSIEAAAGKNPVTHVGKLYNLAASQISNRLVVDVPGVSAASCLLVSQIGRSIRDPLLVDVRLEPSSDGDRHKSTAMTGEIVLEELHRFEQLQADLLAGRKSVY